MTTLCLTMLALFAAPFILLYLMLPGWIFWLGFGFIIHKAWSEANEQ